MGWRHRTASVRPADSCLLAHAQDAAQLGAGGRGCVATPCHCLRRTSGLRWFVTKVAVPDLVSKALFLPLQVLMPTNPHFPGSRQPFPVAVAPQPNQPSARLHGLQFRL